MDSTHGKVRMNLEGDRLSNLPNDLIHKILSYIGIKHAIQTCALSSRWRYIWTSMPSLNFSSESISTNFVTHVLSGRNNETDVSSVNLTFDGTVSRVLVKRILDYAFSHSVQQLNIITCLPEKEIEYPLCVFSSHSLKDLTLTRCAYIPTCELPALTTLNLERVKLNDNKGAGLFANYVNLKNLKVKECWMIGLKDFNICHPGLCSLTLEDSGYKVVNVVTPQLKILTIKRCRGLHKISTPNLSSLRYEDDYRYCRTLLQFSTNHLHLEMAHLCTQCPYLENKEYTQKMVCLLQQLHSVKFLTLNLGLVKLLCSFVELISHQPSPFTNLKSLKIYPDCATLPIASLPNEVRSYLLDGSPGVIFTMVSNEAVLSVISARNHMNSLHVQLEQFKENSEINPAQIKASTVSSVEMMLMMIKGLLTKVPASDRDKLHARFSGLCAKADTLMVQMECDKKPSRSNFFFHEFATSSSSSS